MKPLNLVACAGTAAHHGFERWAGVGMFLEPWLGRRNSNAFWTAVFLYWLVEAGRGSERSEGRMAFGAGSAVAGALVHFADWPWSLRAGFLPWLDEAEGLPPERLAAYNTILWTWLLGGLGSALVESPRGRRRWALAGLATAPALRASARHHFRWAREQARKEPERWSPALREAGGP